MKTPLAVVAVLLTLLFATTAEGATLRLTPAKAPAGSTVTAVGTGFARSHAGVITLGGRVVARPGTSSAGSFTRRFRVPALSRGPKRVVATAGRRSVKSIFTIGRKLSSSVVATSGGQRVVLTPILGTSGRLVKVSGVGFPRGAQVRVLFAGSQRLAFRASARGILAVRSFRVPASTLGAKTVTVRWGTTGRMSIPFTVRRCNPNLQPILVCTPYLVDFTLDHGGRADKDGMGTGFTYVDPPSNPTATGYLDDNLDVAGGALALTTTAGLAFTSSNSQDNALGVGIKPDTISTLTIRILNPPGGTGNSEQAGLWFGNDEDNYVKLAIRSKSDGSEIQYLMEVDGAQSGAPKVGAVTLPASSVTLRLTVNPTNDTIAASYSVAGGTFRSIGSFTAPSAFFSRDAAGIDPTIGTNSFGGIFASHRNGPSPVVYRFDSFTLTSAPIPAPEPPGNFDFNRFSINAPTTLDFPTSMVFGPDGRLYVTELLGEIHAYRLNSSHRVVADDPIDTLGSRLTLGIAIDPASTASNVILWVSHSDPELRPPRDGGSAPPNSSRVSRLSGANFATQTDVITGLPRSASNHSVNSLQFGPDGRLYIAQGGNTGAGAPNSSAASVGEFGTLEEQALSAAILVANVKAAGFDGSCTPPSLYANAPCDVTPFATGFRNAYDFVFHSNGSMYAPDNGASVNPSYPRSPTAPCDGLAPFPANDVGDQNDFLMRIVAGKYYGHPNPARDQCVFKDGSQQGVAPLANWVPPIADLGPKASADGIIEYRANTFGGRLKGSLLITKFAQPNNVTRVRLSTNGRSVLSMQPIATGFAGPLPIVQGPDGTIYVGEFDASRITALVPQN